MQPHQARRAGAPAHAHQAHMQVVDGGQPQTLRGRQVKVQQPLQHGHVAVGSRQDHHAQRQPTDTVVIVVASNHLNARR